MPVTVLIQQLIPQLAGLRLNDDPALTFHRSVGSWCLSFVLQNDYKGKGISGRDHYIFCSRVMVGTACTA